MNIVNIAGYRFVALTNLTQLKQSLLTACSQWQLKGTILLSEEGVNLMLAGSEGSITAFKQYLANDHRFANMDYRQSYSEKVPFNHLFVKLKAAIIPTDDKDVSPTRLTGKRLSPEQFKQWLDEDKELLILDTRNEFEVEVGAFDNAQHLSLTSFRQFSHAIESLDASDKKRTVVTYCTGGVRCEKATAVMLKKGFEDVYQLDGGILHYFEQCGGEYFTGDCFVFDERVALDSALLECQS